MKTVDKQLWDAAILKVKQLEAEIRKSDATRWQKSDMLHTLSKLWMFATDAVPRRDVYAPTEPSGTGEKK